MKPYLMKACPVSSDLCPYTGMGGYINAYREEGHVKMEAEIRVMLPQVKEYKGELRVTRSYKEARKCSSLELSEGV